MSAMAALLPNCQIPADSGLLQHHTTAKSQHNLLYFKVSGRQMVNVNNNNDPMPSSF